MILNDVKLDIFKNYGEIQKEMDNNPDLWIGLLTNDIHHWAECGVHTPGDLEAYLDREAEREMRKEAMY